MKKIEFELSDEQYDTWRRIVGGSLHDSIESFVKAWLNRAIKQSHKTTEEWIGGYDEIEEEERKLNSPD